jgi:hypothetical protein
MRLEWQESDERTRDRRFFSTMHNVQSCSGDRNMSGAMPMFVRLIAVAAESLCVFSPLKLRAFSDASTS